VAAVVNAHNNRFSINSFGASSATENGTIFGCRRGTWHDRENRAREVSHHQRWREKLDVETRSPAVFEVASGAFVFEAWQNALKEF